MSKELRNKIFNLYENGYKRKEIAEKLQIQYPLVVYYLSSCVTEKHNEKYKGILDDSRIMRQSDIARKYNVSRQYVSSVIKKNGNEIKN